MEGNPLKDHRAKRILEKEKLPVKPLLMHIRKQSGGKKGGGKKGKGKSQAAERAPEPEPAPAPADDDTDEEDDDGDGEGDAEEAKPVVVTPELIGRKIEYLYQQKNPAKIGDVAKLMIKYKGKEQALYAAMVKKYQFDESFFDDMPPPEESSEEEEEEEEEEEDDDEKEVAPAPKMSAEAIQQRILKVYQEKNPDKVGDVPKLMAKYKGKEGALFKAIMDKYEIETASYFAAEDAADAEAAELAADPAEQARLRKIEEKKQQELDDMAEYLAMAKQAEQTAKYVWLDSLCHSLAPSVAD
eukprot:SAG22_NODE_1387_length_4524_cov_2.915028_3_plen_299_part_00